MVVFLRLCLSSVRMMVHVPSLSLLAVLHVDFAGMKQGQTKMSFQWKGGLLEVVAIHGNQFVFYSFASLDGSRTIVQNNGRPLHQAVAFPMRNQWTQRTCSWFGSHVSLCFGREVKNGGEVVWKACVVWCPRFPESVLNSMNEPVSPR